MTLSDLAIVVLVPSGATGEVHSTLLYFDVTIVPQMCQIVRDVAAISQPVSGVVTGLTEFGGIDGSPTVSVALLNGGELSALHDLLVDYESGPWGYSPHISEQPGQHFPAEGTTVVFDRIAVWNHDEKYAWRLGTGARCAT